jgi:glutathione reductase (NADPH)
MAAYDYDLFVLGAGSGGTRASRIAASHGARVAVAEEYRVGGTCVIRGCVPKKLLVYGAHFAEDLRDARQFGWQVPSNCAFSWETLRDNVMAEVDRINGAYTLTLESQGVEIYAQRAVVAGPNLVRLADGSTRTAERILVAVGSRPAVPECRGYEHGISSNEVFQLPELPRRILIAGGGYIANEFAGIFHQLGSHVILANRTQEMLRGYDAQIRDRLLQISTMKGIDFRFDAAFESIERAANGSLTAHLTGQDPISIDQVLFAIGRLPNTDDMGLELAGVEMDSIGAVKVDGENRSTCPSIYAIGDVTNRIQLTPIAIREGQAFADRVYGGKPGMIDYDCVPAAVFSHPPLAGVGLTEARARETLGSVKVYSSDFRPMKNVLAGRNERALYKMVCDGVTDRIVGIHMIGPDCPEIIQVCAVAVKAGLTKADFDATVALHPSMAEELVLMR